MNQDCRRTVAAKKQDCRRSPVCHHAPSGTLRDVCFVSSWGTPRKKGLGEKLTDSEWWGHMRSLSDRSLPVANLSSVLACPATTHFSPGHCSPLSSDKLINVWQSRSTALRLSSVKLTVDGALNTI
ncbi:hypothetical protein LSTR_LSTR014464 [Laodelphax striatellus]|uniref:Uncharacterized protein n=1 Tax=Laodelphax striatellus TaxID=195883 RepID=A0A482WRN1_LAOST|nr:hypothetical protein LSTR_LSTR014464 [Laodelphax striatellus]